MKIVNIFSGAIIGGFCGFITTTLISALTSIVFKISDIGSVSGVGEFIGGFIFLTLIYSFITSFIVGIAGAIFGVIIGAINGGAGGSAFAGLEWFFIVGIATGLGLYFHDGELATEVGTSYQALNTSSYLEYGLLMGISGGITGYLTWLTFPKKNKKAVIPGLLLSYIVAFAVISYIVPLTTMITYIALSD